MPVPNGPKNQPRYDLNDDSDFAADLTAVSDYAAKVGNTRTGTTTERTAASGLDVWEGLEWVDTTDGFRYRRRGAAWRRLDPWFMGAGPLVGTIPTELGLPIIHYVHPNLVVATNADGVCNGSVPSGTFPNALLGFILQRRNFANYGVTQEIEYENAGGAPSTLQDFYFRIYNSAGSPLPNISGVQYMAHVFGC